MKAVILKQPGEIENLVVTDVAEPIVKDGEVLVKVKAFSINPVDIKTRKGLALYNNLKENNPLILGWDISGEVVAIGNGVTQFKNGDEVFGMVNFPGYGKAYAEYVAAPAIHLAQRPTNVTHQQAAASTLALLTAWQVLVQQAKVQRGERVLMHAAAGGVGHFGVQVAKHLGAHVIGSGSASSADFIKELGADEFFDYKKRSVEEEIRDIDVVFDAVGGDNPMQSIHTLRSGGRLVAIAGGITDDVKKIAEEKGIKAWPYLVQSNGSDMQELAQLLEKGIIKPHVSKEFSINHIKEAHRQIETGHTKGKIVVVP